MCVCVCILRQIICCLTDTSSFFCLIFRYIDQIITYKFEYVVTPQTYGHLRDSKDVKLRWLADSINILLQRYGRLKAAFLDTAETENGLTQYSVCIKGRSLENSEIIPVHVMDDEQPVFEIYRVRLPTNR